MDRAPPYVIDLRASLFIPGFLHILSNMTKDFLHALEGTDVCLPQLRHICRLLSRRWSRDRFIQTCCQALPAMACTEAFKHFNASVYIGRWGAVTHACGEVLRCQQLLRAAWNENLYRMGGQVQEGDENHGVRLQMVSAGIHSGYFWAFVVMIDMLAESLELVQRWCEACPCQHLRAHSGSNPWSETPS